MVPHRVLRRVEPRREVFLEMTTPFLTLKMDAAGVLVRMNATVMWAVESGLLTEKEAVDLLVDEIVSTLEVMDERDAT